MKRPTSMSPEDAVVLTHMANTPLKPGQMLWLGPKSIAILLSGKFEGRLPDRMILERGEWEHVKRPSKG